MDPTLGWRRDRHILVEFGGHLWKQSSTESKTSALGTMPGPPGRLPVPLGCHQLLAKAAGTQAKGTELKLTPSFSYLISWCPRGPSAELDEKTR